MNKLKNNLLLTLMLAGIWVGLNGNLQWPTILIGLTMAVVTIMLLTLLHPHQSDLYDYYIPPLLLLRFLVVLFKNIYLSAFKTIINLIKGQINPQFVPVATNITRPWFQALLGNAITLTPGTVTIHLEKNEYIVLVLELNQTDPIRIKEELVGEFEKVLDGGDGLD